MLLHMIERLLEIGKCDEMEMNVKKTKVMGISRPLENVEYINCLARVKTYDARCTSEIKSRIAITEAAFNKIKSFSPANWA